MKYYSTNNPTVATATLQQAVTQGLAPDRGLYMPQQIPTLPADFFARLPQMSLAQSSFEIATALFGDDIPAEALRDIVYSALNFDIPVVEVRPGVYALELFHGPTLAFKDVGARFMARMLGYFNRQEANTEPVNVLVATSGDTGSAVANGFLDVEGVRVFVLYPSGKVSATQEAQFATLGRNITAIEVDGVFDDCQRLVKTAFLDPELNSQRRLTSANSINVARFLPQMFYYFHALSQLMARGVDPATVLFSVPSGNFGNLCSALIGHRMGMPAAGFIAANNANDVVYQYLSGGEYVPRASVQTIANAMDVGDPSNWARIVDLYGGDRRAICADIVGATYTDDEIRHTMRQCLAETGYMLDPHGAVAYRALSQRLRPGQTGVFLETAHPAKFSDTVLQATGAESEMPARLAAFLQGTKQSVPIAADYAQLRDVVLEK